MPGLPCIRPTRAGPAPCLQANALAPAKPPSIRIETIFTNWLPFVALAAVYAATQVAAKLKVRRCAAARYGCRVPHGCIGRFALALDP
jgi:hypothetical protein